MCFASFVLIGVSLSGLSGCRQIATGLMKSILMVRCFQIVKIIEVFPVNFEELRAPPQDVFVLGIAVDGEETIPEQWDFHHFCPTAQEFGYFCV